jgi:hypothetical protein
VDNKWLQDTQFIKHEASAAHGSLPMEIQPDLRRSCGRARDKLDWNPEAHAAPRNEMMNANILTWVQGVRGIQRLLDIQSSCKSATLTLPDFTISSRPKQKRLALPLHPCA